MEMQGMAPMASGALQPQDVNVKAPEATPVNFQENRGKWADFMNRIQTDPNMRQTLLQTGLRMMQGPKQGQNNLSLFGDSLESGVNTLQALRERDRLHQIEAQDRLLKQKDTESQISTRERGASVAERGADNQDQRTMLDYNELLSKNESLRKNHQLALDQLNGTLEHQQGTLGETIRHNKATEAIDASRAKSYSLAAGGGGGGSTAADTVKIENLAADYVAQGMNSTEAKARATREVMSTGKARDPSAVFNDSMKVELAKWQSNFDNLGKEPDPATWQAMRQSAMESTKQMLNLQGTAPSMERSGPIVRPQAGQQPGAAPTQPAAAQPAPATGSVAPAPAVDAKTQETVKLLRGRGTPDDKIRAALVKDGKDPKAYGL